MTENNMIEWEEFTQAQKNEFQKLLKKGAANNPNIMHPAAKFFKENGWVKIEKFIDKNMANYFYHYITLEAQRALFIEEVEGKEYNKEIYGTFSDSQAPGDFSKYGDLAFDSLLSLGLDQVEMFTNKELVPTYSYHRLYTKGTELKKHKDRDSCEISTTLCLGYDVSNVDSKKYPDWSWPMFIEKEGDTPIPVHMSPGDMIIYRGCELHHWREPYKGNNHAQVFLHYNEKNKEVNNIFDDRPVLGLSAKYKTQKNTLEDGDVIHPDVNIVD